VIFFFAIAFVALKETYNNFPLVQPSVMDLVSLQIAVYPVRNAFGGFER